MAKAAAGGGGADSSVADQRELGVRGCPCADGRARPAPRPEVRDAAVLPPRGAASSIRSGRRATSGRPRVTTTRSLSRPADLVPENVRLSHTWCNKLDYGWRTQIRTLLAKGKSLAEIAETLTARMSRQKQDLGASESPS